MSNYGGHFTLRVKKPDLAPVILSGMRDLYLLYEDQSTAGNQSLLLKPSFDLEMKEPQFMIEPLRLLEQMVNTELESRIKEGGDVSFPYFSLRVTILELKPGKWLNHLHDKNRPLENFPRCHLTEFSLYRSCHVQMSEYDSDHSGRQGQMHRAIEIRHECTGRKRKEGSPFSYENSILKVLSDESVIDEAFNCFKQSYA